MFSQKLTALSGLISAFSQAHSVENISNQCHYSIASRHKIFFAGNGGSSSQADHLAAELTGRFKKDRSPLPAVSLGSNKATLTAVSNDYGYTHAFEREFDSLAVKGDLLIVLSTSGESKNLLLLAEKCKDKGVWCFGLLGRDGGPLRHVCDQSIIIKSNETDLIQEMHLMIGHYICQRIEEEMAK